MKFSLLILDDEEYILEILEEIFEFSGHTTTLAKDFTTALSILNASPNQFDAIITDINMPGGKIEDLLALNFNNNNVPVIITSGEPSLDPPLEQLFYSGNKNNFFLTKPFGPDQILAHLNKILKS